MNQEKSINIADDTINNNGNNSKNLDRSSFTKSIILALWQNKSQTKLKWISKNETRYHKYSRTLKS